MYINCPLVIFPIIYYYSPFIKLSKDFDDFIISYVIAASESFKIPSVVGSFNAFHTDTAIKLNTYELLIALTIKSNNAFHVVKSCAVNPA